MTNLPVETLVSNYNKVVDHYCRPRPELISFVQGRGRKFNGKVVSQGRCLTRVSWPDIIKGKLSC